MRKTQQNSTKFCPVRMTKLGAKLKDLVRFWIEKIIEKLKEMFARFRTHQSFLFTKRNLIKRKF